MILFYGSNGLIDNPIYGYGKASNDYGRGFYLTPDKDMSILWASRFENGFSITYDLDTTNLRILNLASASKEDILKWMTLLITNRFDDRLKAKHSEAISFLTANYQIDLSQYDVIIGYRADDAYFNYSKSFLKGEISVETLSLAIKNGNLGQQVVLISERAFKQITRIGYEKIEKSSKYNELIINASNAFFKLKKQEEHSTNNFITNLIEGGSKNG